MTDLAGVGHYFDAKKLGQSLYELGRIYGETGSFDPQLTAMLARPRKISKLSFFVAQKTVQLIYWDQMLRSIKVYKKRFAQPYQN